jgi:hypothetical protein
MPWLAPTSGRGGHPSSRNLEKRRDLALEPTPAVSEPADRGEVFEAGRMHTWASSGVANERLISGRLGCRA